LNNRLFNEESAEMPVTLSEIAKKAGVSKITVSTVLNKSKTGTRVSTQTRDRIEAVARELGYVPNALAQSLTRRTTQTIGFLSQRFRLEGTNETFASEGLQGAIDAADEAGFHVIAFSQKILHSKADWNSLAEGRCDGLVLFNTPQNTELLSWLHARNVRVVLVGQASPDPVFPRVMVDNRAAISELFSHMRDRGKKKIAYLPNDPQFLDSQERELAYLEVSTAAGQKPLVIGKGDYRNDLAEVQHLLAGASGERPDSLICASDASALACLQIAASLGLEVPFDLAISGVNNISLSASSTPPLTTQAISFYDLALRATQLLIAHCNGEPVPSETRLSPSLIVRSST
jgi:DNA-binding LacI/PurR family transcriptional regulator